MIIQPAKFLAQNPAGQFIDVVMSDPRQIAMAVNQRSYDAAIAAELKTDVLRVPSVRAEVLRETRLVKLSTNSRDPERGALILRTLYRLLKNGLDKKLQIEIDTIETEIKKNASQAELLVKQNAILDNRLRILAQREREILAEKNAAGERIARLQKEQAEALRSGGKEALAQLVFSSIIQESYQYINTLDESLLDKRSKGEDLAQRRKENEQAIEVLGNTNLGLAEKKGKYDYTEMLKEPTVTRSPISPQKTRNVLLAGVLGLLLSGLAVLVRMNLDQAKAGGR
jgi:capsular polysaccharide biosynthesis protein